LKQNFAAHFAVRQEEKFALVSTHGRKEALLSNMGEKGNHVVKGMMGQRQTSHDLYASCGRIKEGTVLGRKALHLSRPNRKH
jgi:hypothetical protein